MTETVGTEVALMSWMAQWIRLNSKIPVFILCKAGPGVVGESENERYRLQAKIVDMFYSTISALAEIEEKEKRDADVA